MTCIGARTTPQPRGHTRCAFVLFVASFATAFSPVGFCPCRRLLPFAHEAASHVLSSALLVLLLLTSLFVPAIVASLSFLSFLPFPSFLFIKPRPCRPFRRLLFGCCHSLITPAAVATRRALDYFRRCTSPPRIRRTRSISMMVGSPAWTQPRRTRAFQTPLSLPMSICFGVTSWWSLRPP